MNKETFQNLMMPVMDAVSGKTVDQKMAEELNQQFPPGSDVFQNIEAACHAAIDAGWMCAHGDEGRRFGRRVLFGRTDQ